MGREHECACGRTHRVLTRAVVIERQGLRRVPDLVERHFPPGRLLVVADTNTQAAAADELLALLVPDLPADLQVLGARTDVPVGDESHVTQVRERLDGTYAAAIAVGAGTVTDLVKLASAQAGIPCGVVATAASMNGYTSAIAAIYADGLKRTLPATPPVWVVADLDVLAAAPRDLTVAGFADLMSKPSSTADWRASSLILGDYFCPFCAELAAHAEAACGAQAARIGQGDPEAVALLIAGLILSGISMAIAGSSSPASGGEHLISHVWDMRRLEDGRPHALHGAQAGLGTLMTAALWRLLRDVPRPDAARTEQVLRARPSWEAEARAIRERLGSLAEPALAEYRAKRPQDGELRRRLDYLAATWHTFWHELDALQRGLDRIRARLDQAGAPTTVRAVGYDPDEARTAFRDARFIRSRYTVFDLATDLGVLEDLAPRALELSGVLG